MVKTNSDFDADGLTRKADEHAKILGELQARVGTNENFGNTFEKAAEVSKSIDKAVENIVVDLLENNETTQAAVKVIIRKMDDRETKKQWLGLGRIILWVISVVVAAVVGAVINSKIK